jgi:hypothetical protein
MASWENWMPELVLAAPKAPVPLIHLALNRAARTFLKATRAWQEWLEPTDVTGEAFAEYTFELPQGAELLRLERATLAGRPLEVAKARDLPADPWQHELRGKLYLVTTNLREFTVRTGSVGRLQVYASLMPSLRGNSVPDEVASLYHEAIREGAKAELLATEGTDYYNPDQAGVALAFFTRAIDDATADVWRSNTSRGSRGRASWL